MLIHMMMRTKQSSERRKFLASTVTSENLSLAELLIERDLDT